MEPLIYILIFIITFPIGGGSGTDSYKEAIKEKASVISNTAYEKGGELASGAYEKGGQLATGAYQNASYVKHAALDWLSSYTTQTNSYDKKDDN